METIKKLGILLSRIVITVVLTFITLLATVIVIVLGCKLFMTYGEIILISFLVGTLVYIVIGLGLSIYRSLFKRNVK